jgi:hypothetical protein
LETVVLRLVTDKPVKKTAYQVKGVFMKHYPNSAVVPMLDGTYRDKFLYPRVQVKILNEQIFVVGMKEGTEPVRSLANELTELNFGNITFEIVDSDIEETNDQFTHIDQLLRYKFVSPWVALGNTTQNRYKFLKNKDRVNFLNKLLGQNLVFLGREMGIKLNDKVYTKIKLSSLTPKPVDEDSWGAFTGEFQTNFILPDYIGIGNGITRGYGAIHSLHSSAEVSVESNQAKNGDSPIQIDEGDDAIKMVNVKNVPKPRRKKNKKSKSKNNDLTQKASAKSKKNKKPHTEKNQTHQDGDDKFNSVEYHQKQHII